MNDMPSQASEGPPIITVAELMTLGRWPRDAAVTFRCPLQGQELRFYRVQGPAEDIVQVELNQYPETPALPSLIGRKVMSNSCASYFEASSSSRIFVNRNRCLSHRAYRRATTTVQSSSTLTSGSVFAVGEHFHRRPRHADAAAARIVSITRPELILALASFE